MEGNARPLLARIAGPLVATLIVIVIVLVGGELLVRLIRPQPSMYPRWQFSLQYGTQLYPGRTILHECPGRWRYTYSVNELGYRGDAIPVADNYDKTNIVVLGDSYAFGTGVADGDEFPAVIGDLLSDRCDVINLSVGGWGLAQEIRRYYEFGRLYDPGVVILQFCSNDFTDNVKYRVTVVEGGRLAFRDLTGTMSRLKRSLSGSIIQRSQLYNLVRLPLSMRAVRGSLPEELRNEQAGVEPVREVTFYCELLRLFADDLSRSGVRLIMISVDGHVGQFPTLEATVRDLESRGSLTYCEVLDWIGGLEDRRSPEGHVWGARAHRMIGEGLAGVIADGGLAPPPASLES